MGFLWGNTGYSIIVNNYGITSMVCYCLHEIYCRISFVRCCQLSFVFCEGLSVNYENSEVMAEITLCEYISRILWHVRQTDQRQSLNCNRYLWDTVLVAMHNDGKTLAYLWLIGDSIWY